MEFSNVGASVYHQVQAVYARDNDGKLLRILGSKGKEFQQSWPSIWAELSKLKSSFILNSEKLRSLDTISLSINSTELLLREQKTVSGNEFLGIIQKATPDTVDQPFQQFFVTLLLKQMRLHLLPGADHPPSHISQLQAQQIVELFNRRLRHTSTNDQWEATGRQYFKDRIYYYTSRELPCEFCLPAFPCKSSNPDKVMGSMPDRGEEMGLLKLHDFAREVEEIYPPGARVWIISDGHVFSDCIGVGDDIVDAYTSKLVEMNNSVGAEQVSNRVKFASLVDLFDLKNSYNASILARDLNIPGINHYVDTCLEDEAELCRCILMSGCQSDRAALRKRIDSGDPAILALYRGFSRFMLEDLELHPATKNMTKSQRKKLSVKVSFEMIMRNQAYSNLVELLFPDHVRLSIHAHNNGGPKFGIQLFEKEFCKPIGMLSRSVGAGGNSDDLLHIPTPWHNCIVEVTDDPNIYVGKSKVIVDALSNGLFTGGWKEGRKGKAGHFQVERLEAAVDQMPPIMTENRHEKTGLGVLLAFVGRNGVNLYRYSFGFGIGLYKRLTRWVPRY